MKRLLQKSNYSLFPVFTTFFLDNFALAVIYPIFTPLFLSLQKGILPENIPIGYRTILLGMLIACFPLAQFFGAPIVGEFSDQCGRKSICLHHFGNMLRAHSFSFSIFIHFLPLLFFARLLTGFFAGNLAVCLAALADLSPDKKSVLKILEYLAA